MRVLVPIPRRLSGAAYTKIFYIGGIVPWAGRIIEDNDVVVPDIRQLTIHEPVVLFGRPMYVYDMSVLRSPWPAAARGASTWWSIVLLGDVV